MAPTRICDCVQSAPKSAEAAILIGDVVANVARHDGQTLESIDLLQKIDERVQLELKSNGRPDLQERRTSFEADIKLLMQRFENQ